MTKLQTQKLQRLLIFLWFFPQRLGGGGSNDITFDNCGFNCCNVTRSHVAIIFLSAIEILSDIVQNSKLDAQEIERERDVILREMEVSLNKNIFTVNLF